MTRIAVVSYYFPPSTAVGALRWAAMARHLRAMGHDVTVVTSGLHGGEDEPGVIRTLDLGNTQALRKLLRRPGLAAPGTAAPALTPAPALLTRVVVPDSYLVSWLPAALAAVARLEVDCLITTGPPDSTHLLALALPRRPAWIADFRDGWRFEALREPWPSRAQERLDAWLERRVVRTADAVIGATSPIAEDFRTRIGVPAEWISNGFDPVPIPEGDAAPDDGWLHLVHTGTLSGPRGRDPRPLLRALRDFNAGTDGRRIRLVLAGRPSVEDERLIAEAGLGDALRHLGLLDRPATLRLQRDADALLLLTGTHRSEATGKLFEYLASGRPILAVAKDNEAARIVTETRTGFTVHGDLAPGLRAVADGSLERAYAPQGLERFTYPGPANAVAELVEMAVRLRRRPG